MYKKIKNSSFMNLIWFIICLLPLIFITFDYINNGSKYIEGERVDNILIYSDTEKVTNFEHFYTWSNDLIYILNNEIEAVGPGQNNSNNYMILNIINYGFDNELEAVQIRATTEMFSTNNDIYIYYRVRSLNSQRLPNYYGIIRDNATDNRLFEDSIKNDSQWGYVKMNYQQFYDAEIYFSLEAWQVSDDNLSSNYCAVEFFISQQEIILESSDNLFYKYTNGYYDLLQTIQTNGFISNAFLNLSQFFGVTNVYYSLACYYIEYLLVIVLLHLAFDVLYILPNVCHKFMEKIGGERD